MGIRDILQLAYLVAHRLDDFYENWEKYKDDYTVAHFYNEALFWYLNNGPSEEAFDSMIEALEFNPYVLDLLTRKEILDDFDLDFQSYNPREAEGALDYCTFALKAWWTVPGIQTWLLGFYELD